MTLPDYTVIYNRIYASLEGSTEGVPHEELHKTAEGITSSLWSMYEFIEKENLPSVGNAVIDSVLELYQ